jgi:hypothetical protein
VNNARDNQSSITRFARSVGDLRVADNRRDGGSVRDSANRTLAAARHFRAYNVAWRRRMAVRMFPAEPAPACCRSALQAIPLFAGAGVSSLAGDINAEGRCVFLCSRHRALGSQFVLVLLLLFCPAARYYSLANIFTSRSPSC